MMTTPRFTQIAPIVGVPGALLAALSESGVVYVWMDVRVSTRIPGTNGFETSMKTQWVPLQNPEDGR